MFCKHCGKEIMDDSAFCTYCGGNVRENSVAAKDESSPVLAVWGFFIPVVGFLLWLIYHEKQPLMAKSAAKGALIGWIVSAVLSALYVIVMFVVSAFLLMY